MKKLMIIGLCIAAAGCQSPGDVTDKVLSDFGLKPRPEGYVSGADRVMQRMDEVGKVELKRLNAEGRHGEIKYQDEGLRGMYYKEVKVYDKYFPLDARPITKAKDGKRGYHGYIAYEYRIFQSPRQSNPTEAAAESATIPVETQGRETYRYQFGPGGVWDGGKGQRSNR